jgi:hypothetical protein
MKSFKILGYITTLHPLAHLHLVLPNHTQCHAVSSQQKHHEVQMSQIVKASLDHPTLKALLLLLLLLLLASSNDHQK